MKATPEHQQEFADMLDSVQLAARGQLWHKGYHGDRLDEAIQEATALAFNAFLKAKAAGNDRIKPYTLGKYAALQVRVGRHLAGCEAVGDAMSVQNRKQLERLTDFDTGDGPAVNGLIAKKANPADAAAYRVDTETWLEKLSERDRVLATDMAQGHTTSELAERHKISPGRISQKRREFAESYGRE